MFEQKIRIVLCIILMVYHKKRAPIFGHNAKNLMLFKNSLDFSISILQLTDKPLQTLHGSLEILQ